jgi:hypothetical protein
VFWTVIATSLCRNFLLSRTNIDKRKCIYSCLPFLIQLRFWNTRFCSGSCMGEMCDVIKIYTKIWMLLFFSCLCSVKCNACGQRLWQKLSNSCHVCWVYVRNMKTESLTLKANSRCVSCFCFAAERHHSVKFSHGHLNRYVHTGRNVSVKSVPFCCHRQVRMFDGMEGSEPVWTSSNRLLSVGTFHARATSPWVSLMEIKPKSLIFVFVETVMWVCNKK